MKNITKIISTVLLSSCIMSSAIASQAYYGTTKVSASNAANNSRVFLINHTGLEYTVYTTFHPTGASSSGPLSPYGTDTFDINETDYEVCLTVVENYYPGETVFDGCVSSGRVDVGPWMTGTKKPSVNVVK